MPDRSIRVARVAGLSLGGVPATTRARCTGSHLWTPMRWGSQAHCYCSRCILAHEFGHALVARRRGVKIEEIDLWLLGGVARMSGRPKTASDELRFALAGPAVTAVVAAIFGALALALPSSAPAALRAVIAYQAEINLLI